MIPTTVRVSRTLAKLRLRWRRNSAYSQKRQDIKEIDDVGRLLMEEYPAKTKHTDLSKGDEVSTAAQLYLQKVRAFYFTLDRAFALWDAIRRPVLSYFSRRRLK